VCAEYGFEYRETGAKATLKRKQSSAQDKGGADAAKKSKRAGKGAISSPGTSVAIQFTMTVTATVAGRGVKQRWRQGRRQELVWVLVCIMAGCVLVCVCMFVYGAHRHCCGGFQVCVMAGCVFACVFWVGED
jgi:hypothetical protein